MPGGRRPRQVADLLRGELARLIQRSVRDPRVGFVTLTGVDLSPDLRHARVYVSVLGEKERAEEAIRGLEKATGFLRRELASRLRLKQIPELTFHADASLEQGARIERLLAEVLPEDAGDEE